MATVNDVFRFLDTFAPVGIKMDFDNVGLLVGRADTCLSAVIVSLDITSDVISEAVGIGAGLIVSHHPLLFSLTSITDSDAISKRIILMLENGISGICMHTNLDAAHDGVNDILASRLGLSSGKRPLELLSDDVDSPYGKYSYGRIGYLDVPIPLERFLPTVKAAVCADVVRYYDAGRDVSKVALVGGSGGDQFRHVIEKGCDTFVTADIKYDLFLEAKELGVNLVDADHFYTENVVIAPLADRLREAFPDLLIRVSEAHGPTVKIYN